MSSPSTRLNRTTTTLVVCLSLEFALIVCQSSWTPESTALLQVTVADTIGKVNEMLAQPPSVVFEAASPKEAGTAQDTFHIPFPQESEHYRNHATVPRSIVVRVRCCSGNNDRSLAAADHEMAVAKRLRGKVCCDYCSRPDTGGSHTH